MDKSVSPLMKGGSVASQYSAISAAFKIPTNPLSESMIHSSTGSTDPYVAVAVLLATSYRKSPPALAGRKGHQYLNPAN